MVRVALLSLLASVLVFDGALLAAQKKGATLPRSKDRIKQIIQRFDQDKDGALNVGELTRLLVVGRGLIAPAPKSARQQVRNRGRSRVASTGPVRVVQGGRRSARGTVIVPPPANPIAQALGLAHVAIAQASSALRTIQGPPTPAQVAAGLLRRFDRDASGALDETELAAALDFVRRAIAVEQARARALAPIVVNPRGRRGRGRRPRR